MQFLFGKNHGSADEIEVNLTGREWMELFHFNNHKAMYILACILNLFQSTSSFLSTIVQGKLATILVENEYDSAEEFLESINSVSMILIVAILINFIVNLSTGLIESTYLPIFMRDLRVGVLNYILQQDISYFDKHQTGVILSRLTDDVSNACNSYSDDITLFAYYFAQLFSGTIICLFHSWKATLFAIGCFPIYFLSEYLSSNYIDKLYLKYNDKTTDVAAKAEEILTSFRTVRSFDSELREYHFYRHKLFDVHDVLSETAFVRGIKNSVQNLTHWGLASFILFYLAKQAINHEIEPGAIVTIFSIINVWSHTLSAIFIQYSEFKKSNVSSAKLLEIIHRVPKIKLDEGRDIGKVKGSIEFRNVTFKYPTRDDYALDNLSFKINPGETVALVGESGCGKSTTLQLLQRFYDVTDGQILIDGNNISEVNPISLRSQIAIVPQGPVIFSMNVKDNIRYGKPNAHREEIIDSAQIANAHSFIRQLKDGYKTMINHNSLSGGQKQRICIARAIMMKAPILLLDEATAALDTESERMVQEALSNFRQGKTAIIVAHRLATVKHASRIIVMEKGKVIEEGTHEELLMRSGAYAELVKNQLQ